MKANYKDLIQEGCKVVLLGCILVGLICYSFKSYAQEDSWQQKRSLGLAATSRSEAVSFSIGGKGYAGTGVTLGPGNDFWEYDPITDVWTQKANVPGGTRSAAVGFSIGDKGYIGLGDSLHYISHYSDFYEYDPASNVWTRKADFSGGARSGATGFSIGNKGYVGTGSMRDSQSPFTGISTNDFWEFDPASNVWTQKANFAGTARLYASGFSIGEKGYVGLGRNSSYNLYNDFWEYNPTIDVWVKKANFSGAARYGAASFNIGDKGYVGTGYGGLERSNNDFWEYDPTTNAWTQKATYSGDPRELAIGFSIGNKGYLGTGYRSNNEYTFGPKCDLWEYDPALNKWVEKAGLGNGARSDAVGFSIDGKGYVGTGYDGGPKKDFYQYDPATDQWLRKIDFPGGERQHATGFGINAKGYVGQGYARGRQTFVNDFWQYDPVNDTWQNRGVPFSIARADATVFEISGKVYFGMGYYYASNLYDFWEFDPATGDWTIISDWLDLYNTGGFTIGNKSYVLVSYLWEYDLAAHTWIKKHEKPADAEVIGFSFTLAGKGYLFSSNELWEYDLANNFWTPRKAFPGKSRLGATIFTIGDHAYLGFGRIDNVLQNDFWEYTPASEHSITTNLATTTFCSGESGTISYIAKGTFNEGNVFSAELSDTSGNYSGPQIIGTNTSILSGVINVTIPDSLRTGHRYRIRVVSSNPSITGSDNGADLVVNPAPVARTKRLTVYLNERGIAIPDPHAIDSGSTADCGILNVTLDEKKFDCADIGSNKITLTVVDRNGNVATDTSMITVLDTLPPHIWGAYAIPNTLWPPNHKMKEVTLLYWVSDNCSILNKSLSVASNEPPGGGTADWVIVDDHHVLLRAEKNGHINKERAYYITITAKDFSGNTTTKVVTVAVSSDHREDEWSPADIKKLIVNIVPNPSHHLFTLIFKSKCTQSLNLRVTDIWGRLIETRNNITPNGSLQIGSNYIPGTYYVLVVQGKERLTLRIVKQ
jgi:N-acetylneuraminic acid mutarotase